MVAKTKRTRESRTAQQLGAVPWSVERRLAFVEDRLFWLGRVKRSDLVDRFDVSMSQASGDLGRYLTLNPKGVDYDRVAKRYVAGAGFRPVLSKPDALRFLGELRLVEAGLMPESLTITGSVPPFATTPVPERKIDAPLVRTILQAISTHSSVAIVYQSMSRPEPAQRTIEPHAFAFDGFRWHARAFDRETDQFRDFVLGRMANVRLGGPASRSATDDVDWNIFVDLQIGPHPGLTVAQAKAISLDYGLEGAKGTITVRRSLLYYALKRLGLDQDHNTRPPQVQQIVLLNRRQLSAQIQNPQT